MSLLTVTNLGKSFGAVDIFAGINFSLPQRARIAIVGPNGIGKTTLLRILVGLDSPSSGYVQMARSLNFGYLPQEAALRGAHTLWQECVRAFEHLIEQEQELTRLEQLMSDPGQAEEALQRYGPLQAEFELRGGYTYPQQIRTVLSGLGFSRSDYDMPLSQLSGGQRTRALLAHLLLSNPDLLVLDEPTNHLDIAAVEWLESFLNDWDGAALIVSHDRYFLDKVCNAIWEMNRSGLETYRGNYTAYLQQRQERWELRRQRFETEIERISKELEYVRRNIAGQRTQQAKGKLKRVSRIIEAIEQVGVEAVISRSWSHVSEDVNTSTSGLSLEEAERRLRAISAPADRPLNLNLHLRTQQRSGNLVLRTSDLEIGYPGNPLFHVPDLELRRLECAALIGPNGAGKTTFLKTILGKIPPISGESLLGASLRIGYFAQAHEDLNQENSLIQEIESAAPHMLPGEIRSYLARFLFTGDDVFKLVSMLSGGEGGRLALAKLALSDSNLLLLDEPTNHLDIPSQEVLQSILDEYQGTILLVSHDRYLIDALATQIWEVDVDESSLQIYKGSYSRYRAEKAAQSEPGSNGSAVESEQDVSGRTEFERKARLRNRTLAEQRRRKTLMDAIEQRIHALESKLGRISGQLEAPPADPVLVQKLGEEYLQVQSELDSCFTEWEALHAEG